MRFRLCTVTDYHNIIQHLRIFFQRHIHNCTFANRFRLINVTDIRINQNCLGIRNLNGVFTFSVRHSTGRNGSVFHCHRSSNQRTLFIYHLTSNYMLGVNVQCPYQQQEHHHDFFKNTGVVHRLVF